MTHARFALVACLLMSCADDPASRAPIQPLGAREQLIRLSMDLRGVHPSADELAAIEADPLLYEDFVERYLEDPRLTGRVLEIFDGRFLTRTYSSYDQQADGFGATDVAWSIAEEPLQLVARILEHDLPYSEIVLADYTMANPVTAAMWDQDYPEGGTSWEQARYDDGRDHAGILSMNSMWLRYPSAGGNANRHRANAISKMLMCHDYLSRPLLLDRAAVDQLVEDAETAINTNATCQSCHSTLDPLSAHMFGFFVYDDEDMMGNMIYRPENEEAWRDYSGKGPGFYGQPTANLGELAEAIVDDPRFADCAVQTVFEGLTQRTLTDDDWTEIQAHRAVFVDGGLQLRPLIRSVVNSEEYKAGVVNDPDLGARLAPVKTASPAQLASLFESKTGYRWRFGGADGLTTHGQGLPVLFGGIDDQYVTTRSYEPGVGAVYVQERLAWSAAWHVVQHDLDPTRTGDAILLAYVTQDDTPASAPAAFDKQIRHLYSQLTGLPLTPVATEPERLVLMWDQLYSIEQSTDQAWAGVVTAVLRDPRLLHY